MAVRCVSRLCYPALLFLSPVLQHQSRNPSPRQPNIQRPTLFRHRFTCYSITVQSRHSRSKSSRSSVFANVQKVLSHTLCTGQLWFIKRVCLPQGTYLCLNSTASLAVLASIYCAIAIPAMWLQAVRALPELFDHLQLLTLLADGFLILAGWTECWGCCFSSISFQQGGVYVLNRQRWYTTDASDCVQTLHKKDVQPSAKGSRYGSLRSTNHLYRRLLTAHRPP